MIFNLDTLYVNRIQSFFAIFQFERNTVIFTDLVNKACLVNEDVLVCIVSHDEAEALRYVVEFYFTCLHDNDFIIIEAKVKN
jgi:hypothetical protein